MTTGRHQHTILTLLDGIHPGHWLPLHQIGDYTTNTPHRRAIQQAAHRLTHTNRIDNIRVAFNKARHTLIRNPHNTPNITALQETLNNTLEPIGHYITITAARKISTNFTPHTVEINGHTYTTYAFNNAWTINTHKTRHWHTITPANATNIELPTPGITGPRTTDGQTCPWPWEPQQRTDLGQYHCPYCGEMVLGGHPHPDYTEGP